MRNWAGNLVYATADVRSPGSVAELQELVAGLGRFRPLGTRHAFSDVADTDGVLVALERLPRRLELSPDRGTVTVDGASRYGDVCEALDRMGVALHNLPSLPHVSIAGAVATGTHGSGDRLGNLSTAVVAVELVRPDGELVRLDRAADEDVFPGAVVAIGALGVVTALVLAVEPSYEVAQEVIEDVPFEAVLDAFDAVTAAATIVSLFSDWTGRFHQVWLKRRVDEPRPELPPVLARARRATAERHPIPGLGTDACTPQLGVPGPWHARLPHFRLDHVPSAGAELQSEFFVGREDAPSALAALAPLASRLAPLVWVTEVRTLAADDLWLSPARGRPSVAIHFTWRPDWDAVRPVLGEVERRLAPFEPRPHWGKLFTIPGDEVRARYPERGRFAQLARRFDPEGKLRNRFLETNVFGR